MSKPSDIDANLGEDVTVLERIRQYAEAQHALIQQFAANGSEFSLWMATHHEEEPPSQETTQAFIEAEERAMAGLRDAMGALAQMAEELCPTPTIG